MKLLDNLTTILNMATKIQLLKLKKSENKNLLMIGLDKKVLRTL